MSMDDIAQIEKGLWSAADKLRANSDLASNEYFLPVMGLIFLRHAYSRYQKVLPEVTKNLPSRGGKTRPLQKEDFVQKNAIFLPENAQFPSLAAIPEGEDIGQKIVEAMEAIEKNYPDLRGVLPKQEYKRIGKNDIGGLLRTFSNPALERANGDVFGRIYEYFLTEFADQKAHDGGEFFTPPSLVQTIVNVIEPNRGKIIDPACGSGGMFVQSAHFIEQTQAKPKDRATFYGMEKNPTTIRLAKMNLAVHGLEGDIKQAISYYEDPHNLAGKADFVMANPPFNVDEIDAERIENDPRLAFGLPGVNGNGKVSNGNYVWLSYFYSYLSPTGRAGIVMSSQASSAGGEEAKVRQALIKTGAVDVMIAIRNNFFYTRSVPCELWFFNKNKPQAMRDKVLMIDAREIFNEVNRRIFDFTEEQKKNIAAIVWLYRGEKERFLSLVAEYLTRATKAVTKTLIDGFESPAKALLEASKDDNEAQEALTAKLGIIIEGVGYIASATKGIAVSAKLSALKATEGKIANLAKQANETIKEIDQFHKQAVALSGRRQQKKIRALAGGQDALIAALQSFCVLHSSANWLLARFPDGKLADVEGLVKLVSRAKLEANDWSLTPGRYVGIAAEVEDEDFDFAKIMKNLHAELEELNIEAKKLAKQIAENARELQS